MKIVHQERGGVVSLILADVDGAFAEALDGGAPLPRGRVLAIGDAIRTDVAGARAFGIASLLVARGIHAEELGVAAGAPIGDIAHWLEAQTVHPDAVIDLLRW